jgi:Protein of unknown function (DUF3110)
MLVPANTVQFKVMVIVLSLKYENCRRLNGPRMVITTLLTTAINKEIYRHAPQSAIELSAVYLRYAPCLVASAPERQFVKFGAHASIDNWQAMLHRNNFCSATSSSTMLAHPSCAFCTTARAPLVALVSKHTEFVSRRPRALRAVPARRYALVLATAQPPAPAPGDEDGEDEKDDETRRDDGEGEDAPGVLLDMGMLSKRMREVQENAADTKEEVMGLTLAFDHEISAEVVETDEMDEDALRMLNDDFNRLDRLFVILFNAADDTEGVYSLSMQGQSIVLAFQERSEARTYAMMLEAQDFPRPNVGEFSANELKSFCGEAGFRLGLVPKGSLLTPPEENVDENLEKWTDASIGHRAGQGIGLEPDEVELMKKRFEGLFGGGSGISDVNTDSDG